MLIFPVLLALAPLAAFASVVPRSVLYNDFLTKHSWPAGSPSPSWKYHSTPDPNTPLTIRIGLRPSNFDQLLGHLSETSDPYHSRYGAHLTKEHVEELMQPSEETKMEVTDWLNWHGMDNVEILPSSRYITLVIPVSLAETLLNTTYHVYAHTSDSSNQIIRTMEYSLPRHLHAHINLVSPTTYFGNMRSMKKSSFLKSLGLGDSDASNDMTPSSCSTIITPTCLQDLYHTANYTPSLTTNASFGIAGYLEEYAIRADLATFVTKFLPNTTNATFTTVLVNGGKNNQSEPGVEANLDVQYGTGMAYPIPMYYYSTGGSPRYVPDEFTPTDTNEPYLDWLDYILTLSNGDLPKTFSTSYGDDEQTVPDDYAFEVCNKFAELGARGASVLFSSGDDGVGGGNCSTNDGTNTVLFQPNFPASCPYVTTVGSTVGISPETAASFSAGGFSRLFAQPSYQSYAVSRFLTALNSSSTPYTGLYNASGRAYPDVSAQGEGFQVVIGGQVGSVGGTSCSSPTVAGIIALLNDYKLATNGTTLGFLNPLLYANAAAFNDIVSGSNPGCGTNGFEATTGWDPVTGLGTPDFVKLQSIV
ncbi:peptidase S8/S53 domain-containing protein [Rhodocollybia butyracea]|uniref:tripeptidyl-peptidase II n=1 Tax=Rhodocollybia butyracea TaxID=206335 RepID=A0A9P5U991_9AGAR|nr:peptidase S8/S53 domain-containing protein [Rhodocollybia butyracea]